MKQKKYNHDENDATHHSDIQNGGPPSICTWNTHDNVFAALFPGPKVVSIRQ